MSAEDIVALVGHVAWPLTVLVILALLRREVRSIVLAIRDRMADRSTDVKISTEGLELSSRVQVLEASVESQQLKTEVLATLATPNENAPGALLTELPPDLLSLAERYRDINEPDRSRRVIIKNEIAQSMGAVVLAENVDRQVLADKRDEILTLALAGAVVALPRMGDDELLLLAGKGVQRLHVRYRVAAALAQLAQSRYLRRELAQDALRLLDSYRASADDVLLLQLDRTAALVTEYARSA